MRKALSILVAFHIFGTLVYAKSLVIVQPNGGEFFKGSPLTVNWTKDFPKILNTATKRSNPSPSLEEPPTSYKSCRFHGRGS